MIVRAQLRARRFVLIGFVSATALVGCAGDGSGSGASDAGDAPPIALTPDTDHGDANSTDSTDDIANSGGSDARTTGDAGAKCSDPNTLVCDDFESNVLKAKDGGQWADDCGGEIVTDVVHGGKHAYHSVGNKFAPCYSRTPFGNRSEIYLHMYWYVPPDFDFVRTGGGGHAWRFYYDVNNEPACIGCQLDSAVGTQVVGGAAKVTPAMCASGTYWGNSFNFNWFWRDAASVLQNQNFYTKELAVGRWSEVELSLKLNDPGKSNGAMRYWVDGTPRVEQSDLNLRYTNPKGINYFAIMTNYAGYGYGCPSRRHDWYYDDVSVLSKAPPGAFGG